MISIIKLEDFNKIDELGFGLRLIQINSSSLLKSIYLLS